jgi:hypothetical protein
MDEESWWLGRYKPWVDHYQTLPLRRAATFMLDDFSPYVPEDHRFVILDDLPSRVDPEKIYLYRFAEHIGNDRRNRHRGWWRSFLFSLQIARQYGLRKIIHIESDAYLISQQVIDYLSNLDSGWTALWCPLYQIPGDATFCRHGFSRSVAHDARKELAVHARRKGILGRQIWGISFTHSPHSGLRLPSHSRIDKSPQLRWACIGRNSLMAGATCRDGATHGASAASASKAVVPHACFTQPVTGTLS